MLELVMVNGLKATFPGGIMKKEKNKFPNFNHAAPFRYLLEKI